MCGRYELTDNSQSCLLSVFGWEKRESSLKSSALETKECFPGQELPILIVNGNDLAVRSARWGFSGFVGSRPVINARAETIFEKPLFRWAAKYSRCLVPVSGFYEWQRKGVQQKYHFSLANEPIFYLAGLWQQDCFVVLTTQANAAMKEIHDRMPVIVMPDESFDWVTDDITANGILSRVPPGLQIRQV